MTKPIRTYEDLVNEKQQLEVLLKAQKELIRYDIEQLKGQLQPAIETISFVGKIITRDHSNALLSGGTNKVIDLLVKKVLLSRSGWVTRMVIPFLLKNYSSHFIADHKGGIMQKLFSWIGGKKTNGKAAPDPAAK